MSDLCRAVKQAAGRREVIEAVAGVYESVQREIQQRRPVCVFSGRCCRFEEYGHRLYVTTAELAAFVAGLGRSREDAREVLSRWDQTGCPFQLNRLCSVHAIRPFGCRMFFCDSMTTQWQNALYERYHEQLKRLHETLGVPYFYMEWRQALSDLLAPQDAAGRTILAQSPDNL